METFFSASLLT